MDPFDPDELEQAGAGKPGVYQGAKWRSGIVRRLFARLKLIVAWFCVTVMPQYGWRVLLSMVLITLGRLLDAASFVVGVHLLTYTFSHGASEPNGLQISLAWIAIGIGILIALASILSFVGNKLAVKVALDYERSSLIEGIAIVRHHQDNDSKFLKHDIDSIVRQAPRMMARSLLQIIGACTSFVLMLAGLATCVVLFPGLTLIILLTLLLLSPLYVFAAIHSTNIGHSIRLNAAAYSTSLRQVQRKWISTKKLDRGRVLEEMEANEGYKAYRDAYSARLTLSARNHLVSNLTLAFVVALSFIWFANEIDLTAKALASLISYLISLRVFASGLAGIFSGVQIINTSLPFYILFLTRDPRITKLDNNAAN